MLVKYVDQNWVKLAVFVYQSFYFFRSRSLITIIVGVSIHLDFLVIVILVGY